MQQITHLQMLCDTCPHRQVPSRQRTEPSAAFGSGIREDALKMYLSPMHARATAGNNSAGPIYNVEVGCLCKLSHRHSLP